MERKPFPPVDQHIVVPEITRDEVIRGRKVIAMPAEAPHAEQDVRLNFVFVPHVRPGYVPAADLITRVSEGSDFATDLSIRKAGTDPSTGSRYLEELSFEVVNTQSKRDIREKAEDLIARGVRRVFAVYVKTGDVGEWSRDENDFVLLDKNGVIEDPLLIRPVAIRAILDAAVADNEVARALWEKGNPEIKRIHQNGQDQGRKLFLVELLRTRFGTVPEAIETRIQSASPAQVDTWAQKLFSAATIDDVVGA